MKIIGEILTYLKKNFLFTIFLLIFLISLSSAFIFYLMEAGRNPHLQTFSQAVWWVLVSMTTVGYGDVVPVTEHGRLLGVFIIFTGVALVSMFTATVSSIFVTKRLREERGLKQINEKGHIILCGWNHTAEQIINIIFQNRSNASIVLINQLPEDTIQNLVYKFKDRTLHYVRGDFAQEDILTRANLVHASTVIIIPDTTTVTGKGSDEKTILTAFSVKAIQPKLKVYAHIQDRENAAYLKKAQVDDFLVSESFSGLLMGEMVSEPGVSQSLLSIMNFTGDNRIRRLPIPAELIGKQFQEAMSYFRGKGLLPIALVKENKPISITDVISQDASFLDSYIEKKFKDAGRSLRKGPQLDVQINPADDTLLEKEWFVVVIK